MHTNMRQGFCLMFANIVIKKIGSNFGIISSYSILALWLKITFIQLNDLSISERDVTAFTTEIFQT